MATLRYWASARAAAGVDEERYDAATLAALLAAATARHGDRLARVLSVASYLVDGDPVGKRPHGDVALTATSEVEVLPPFAGG